MAMVCDACGAKFARDGSEGHATLAIAPPRLDFKMIQSLVSAGKYIEPREHATHDLCRGCTIKALAHLGLPTDICELPDLPSEGSPPDSPPPTGALTADDLRELGLEPDAEPPAR
jgi:hypothetical protein